MGDLRLAAGFFAAGFFTGTRKPYSYIVTVHRQFTQNLSI